MSSQTYGGSSQGLEDFDDGMGQELNLAEYWNHLKRHKWGIIGFGAVATMLGAITAFSIQPVYQAKVTMLIEPDQPRIVANDPLRASTDVALFYETQFEIMRSRSIATMVINKLDLDDNPEFNKALNQKKKRLPLNAQEWLPRFKEWLPAEIFEYIDEITKQTKTPIGKEDLKIKQYNNLVLDFREQMVVTGEQKSQIAIIGFESHNPKLSADVANAIADAYVESGLESRLQMAKQATGWLTQRLDQLRKQLADSEERLKQYQTSKGVVDTTSQQSIISNRLASVTSGLVQARAERVQAETWYRQVQEAQRSGRSFETLKPVIDNLLIQTLKQHESAQSRKVAELSKRYGEKHPKMIAARSDLAEAKRQLDVEIRKIVDGIKREYDVAKSKESQLAAISEDVNKDIRSQQGKEFGLAKLEREVRANRELYDLFLTRFKETEASGETNVTNVRIIDRAEPPIKPIKPRKGLIISAFMIGGMFFGILLSFVREHLDKTFKTPADIERILKIPVVGVLPKMNRTALQSLKPELQTLYYPQSPFAESINNVRTGVLFANPDRPPRTFVVTSSVPGEGKTTLSCNLAASFSRLGHTLLIDADLRKPGLSKIYNVHEHGQGLAGLVAGTIRVEQAIILIKTESAHQYLLTSGPLPVSPLEFLSSRKFAKTLNMLKKMFRYIVIDTAPVLPYSDSIALAHQVDEIVMLIRADDTAHNIASDAIKRLMMSSIAPVGTVLSQVNPDSDDGFGHYYGYYGKYAAENAAEVA